MHRRQAIQLGATLPAVFLPRVQAAPPGTGATNARDYGALGDGASDDTQALLSALAAAQTSAARCLYIPAGVYRIRPASGDLFLLSAPGLTVCGDGVGRTVLQDCDNLTLTGHVRRFALRAERQTVRDLSIVGSPSMSGTYDTTGVSAYSGAISFRIERVECTALYGYGSAGGVGFDCYQDPAIGGGWQWGSMEDCYAHDMPLCTGFGTASSGNAFVRCRAIRCGNTTQRHAFYAQGGYNRFEQCYAEQAGGFSFHAHKQSSTLDASGDQYIDCVSINPTLKHMIVDSTGTPPLTRFVTVRGCLFKGAAEGIDFRVPAIVEGNIFEDVRKQGQNSIVINTGAQGSIVRGNMLRNSYGIVLGAPATAESNTIDTAYGGVGINVTAPDALVRGNRITLAGAQGNGATGIHANQANVLLESNLITVNAPGSCIYYSPSAIYRCNILQPRNGAWTYTVAGVGNVMAPFGTDVVR